MLVSVIVHVCNGAGSLTELILRDRCLINDLNLLQGHANQ